MLRIAWRAAHENMSGLLISTVTFTVAPHKGPAPASSSSTTASTHALTSSPASGAGRAAAAHPPGASAKYPQQSALGELPSGVSRRRLQAMPLTEKAEGTGIQLPAD